MIDHTGITVTDFERSRTFYTAALKPLGYVIREDFGVMAGYGVPAGFGAASDPGGDFWISTGTPSIPRPHFAFSAETRAAVDAFHAAALAAGATGNGGPGLRPNYHADYYAAFVIDPDGYNIEAVCHRPDAG